MLPHDTKCKSHLAAYQLVQPRHAELAPEPFHCVCERAPVCGPASRLHVLPFGPAPRRSLEDRHISPLGILTNSPALCASQTVQQRSVPSLKGPNTCLCSDGAVLLCKRRFSMRTRCLKSRTFFNSNFSSSLMCMCSVRSTLPHAPRSWHFKNRLLPPQTSPWKWRPNRSGQRTEVRDTPPLMRSIVQLRI